ncbi:SPOC domain-containing protein [Ditylenchus destructor]|uniref:SPOC domain-containing protein n=1 Tax=Ditylenchus destructor TaxID=166010 RepID=A0AAD4RAT0_9BILA|nr:SPOC domain-containing protein [Ditylenchus destructor]
MTPEKSPFEPNCLAEDQYIHSVAELGRQHSWTWKGKVKLKEDGYLFRFHRVFGKEDILQEILRDEDGNPLELDITQRLPLDRDLYRTLKKLDHRNLVIMVGVEAKPSVEPLVKYLQERNVTGVIPVKGGVVHIMPPGVITAQLFNYFTPRIAVVKNGTKHFLVLLQKFAPENEASNHASSSTMDARAFSVGIGKTQSSSILAPSPTAYTFSKPPAPKIAEAKIPKEPVISTTDKEISDLLSTVDKLLETTERSSTFENVARAETVQIDENGDQSKGREAWRQYRKSFKK